VEGGNLLDTSEGFDYQKIVQDALRDAVRRILSTVAERGLREQYPREMTVILQNQFWNLEVEPESFSVSLSFNGRRERLTVPFAALTAFVDPSAEFGLRFDGEGEAAATDEKGAEPAPGAERPAPLAEPGGDKGGEVVPFDPRRKR